MQVRPDRLLDLFSVVPPEFKSTTTLVKYPTGLPPTSWDSFKTCYVPFRLFFHYPLKVPERERIIKLLILLLLYFILGNLPAVLINWSLYQTPAKEELWRRYQINFIWQRHPWYNHSFPKTVPFAFYLDTQTKQYWKIHWKNTITSTDKSKTSFHFHFTIT